MKKLVTGVLLILLSVNFAFAGDKITTVWEKGVAQGTLPGWFDTGHLTRGFAYGKSGDNDRLFVVSRNGGSFIYILDAASGDSLGRLDNRNISGGTYHVSDVGVSDDGVIFVCNLALGGTFKVYKWTTEADTPLVALTFDATGKRLGDKITVTGSVADNSVVIWAASANSNQVVKFTTSDNGVTFASQEMDIGTTGGSASAGPLPDGSFYWNGTGKNVIKFTADGVALGTVPGGVVATGSNAIRFITFNGSDELFVTFQYGANNENARVVLVPDGDPTLATTYVLTTTLGANPNTNGAGDVAVQNLGGGMFRVFVLSTNNGFGAYDVNTNYMKGTYYVGVAGTGPGGMNPDFASLKEAFDLLNVNPIAGDCNFFITSNIDEPCIGGVGLGLAVDPSPFFITFKPHEGVSPVVTLAYPSDGNDGPSGGFVLGIPDLGTASHRIAWADIKPTRNIIIDGSNTEGGMTRDLTIQSATTAQRNGMPLVIVGDCQNIVVKNTNFYHQAMATSTSNLFISAIMIRARYDFIPKNILIENNHLSSNFDGVPQGSQGIGFYCASSTLPTGDYPNGVTIKDNLIEGKRRAVALYIAGSNDILNNEIILNQDINDGLTNEAIFAANVQAGSVVNILNNKITKVSSRNSNGNQFGIAAISIETAGTFNVFNNMITGFELTAANPSAYIFGVKNSSAAATMNLYHNTFVMNDLADIGTGNVKYFGIHIADGTNNVKNNIVVNSEDDFASYNFNRPGTNGMIDSDFNNMYLKGTTNAKLGFWNDADATSLVDWTTASGLDANSKSKMVEFVSDSDLHLTGASVGDFDLAGTPLAEVTTDIDGDTRSLLSPYMGADEADVELVNPIKTIAEAKIDADGDFRPDLLGQEVEIQGVIASPNYGAGSQYYMQDETAGIVLYSGTVKVNLNFGDKVYVKGKIEQWRGISEIVPAAASDVVVLSTGNEVIPTVIKIADLGEPYEAMLVQCDSVWIVNPEAWPPTGSNSSNANRVLITDGVDTNYIFIDKDTDLPGWTPPTGLITLIAQCDQYTTAANIYDDGYSFRGTLREHFIPLITPPPTLPLVEMATDGTFDLTWDFNTVTAPGTLTIGDSTASAWGSHVIVYTDEAGSGLIHVKDALFADYTISADFYLVAEPRTTTLYSGLGFRMSHDELKYFRFIYRNASTSNGELWLQGSLGSGGFYIDKKWKPGVDFAPITTGWHNLKVTVVDNLYWAFLDGVLLPGCPYEDKDRILSEGYPGIYKWASAEGTIIFDNFIVTEPVIPPPPEPGKLFTLWAKTQAAGTFPEYISTASYTRGMAYGNVNGADRVYVVTRLGEHRVVIHDAMTGDSLGVIPKPPQAEGVGLFHLNAVDVSDDGMIFVSNMSLGSDATHPFRVYSWKSETDVAATAISYDAAIGRLGDMISVYGSANDNSLKIFAGVASKNMFVKFTTADNGATFTPEVITLPSGDFGTLPNVAETKDGLYYIKSYGRPLFRMDPTTLVMDTVSSAIVGTGASKIKYFAANNKEYLMAYYPDLPGAGGNEKFAVVDITKGPRLAEVAYVSPSIGKVSNLNGAGSVDVKLLADDKFIGYILGTNNGVAAFSNDQDYVVASLDTLFYGDTPVLHANPYGAGFIVGTNGYGDIGKYQRFDFKAGDELFGFKYYFAYKEIVNDPDTLHLVVKTVAEDGMPCELIASIVTTTDVLDTTMMGNVFFLDAPILVEGSVFIGFEWSASADDQFALFADANGEGEKANRAWERFSDGSYNDFGTVLNPNYSWGVDVDLWIAAYYKKALPTGVNDLAGEALPTTYALKQNYPNPFNPSTIIELAVPENADVEIVIFNLLGQKVAEVFKGKIIAGNHRFLFDAKGLSSGIYFYHVKANHFKAVKKMTLMK